MAVNTKKTMMLFMTAVMRSDSRSRKRVADRVKCYSSRPVFYTSLLLPPLMH